MPFKPVPSSHPEGEIVPNLPALIADLPGDDTRPQQTLFDNARQAQFLEHISITGSARSAARAASVSHQTVYRMRRGNGAFRRAWDAALLVGRAHSAATLADRAHEGFVEEVWFHGEKVGERRRFDGRLLLAHLARLDRLEQNADTHALADDFDDILERIRTGADLPPRPAEKSREPSPENGGETLSPRRCNIRSMSPDSAGSGPVSDPAPEPVGDARFRRPCDCIGALHGTDGGKPHFRMTARGPKPVENTDGSGPCCDDPCWPDCEDCPHLPPETRLLGEMEDERPEDAPPLEALGDPELVRECQMQAFDVGEDNWWRTGEDFALYEPDGSGGWRVEREDAGESECAEPGEPDEEDCEASENDGNEDEPLEDRAAQDESEDEADSEGSTAADGTPDEMRSTLKVRTSPESRSNATQAKSSAKPFVAPRVVTPVDYNELARLGYRM